MVDNGKEQTVLLITITTICLIILVACTSSPTKVVDIPLATSEQVTTTSVDATVTLYTVELPEYLGKVWPFPDSTIDLQEYNKSLEGFSLLSEDIGVGVELLAHRIAEEGDFDVNWIQRSSLLIDGLSSQGYVGEFANGAVLHGEYDEQGTLLYRVGGPYYMAWRVPLEPSEHEVIFQVRKTSGAVLEYSWRFTITP